MQTAWVLDYLDDLESDFSAIHRIGDMYAMDGPRFFRLAHRLPAYRGVMRMRAEVEAERASGGSAPGGSPGRREVVDERELRYSAEFAGLADWGSG